MLLVLLGLLVLPPSRASHDIVDPYNDNDKKKKNDDNIFIMLLLILWLMILWLIDSIVVLVVDQYSTRFMR